MNLRTALLAPLALAAGLFAALPASAQAVGDKTSVTLDPALSYIIVQTSSNSGMFSFPVTFLRRPEEADVSDYLSRRKAALEKAHAKWEKKHASWAGDAASWDRAAKASRSGPRPVEPVEPTDANLAFPAIEAENMMTIGPFNRFSKANERSTFVHAVKPGRYVFYGPVNTFVAAGTCMCMGSVEFEVKPAHIVYAGVMQINLLEERARAKAEGRNAPNTELEMADTLNTISWIVPTEGAAIDPRLAGYKIVPADLRAAGRIPNYFGVQIDRLTPLPGILAYDRDKVVDLKAAAVAGTPSPAAAAAAGTN